jgi:hypothetical protein
MIVILIFLLAFSVILFILMKPISSKAKLERKRTESILIAKQDSIRKLDKILAISLKKRQDSILKIETERNEVAVAAELKVWYKTKAGKIQKKYPDWSREDCQRLANREIWIGMRIGMVVYLRGAPNHANPSNYGNGTEWQWCWDNYTPMCFYDTNNDQIVDSYN